MKRIFTLLVAALIVTATSCSRHIPSNGTIAIIPEPSKVEVCEGSFNLSPETAIVLHFEDAQLALATDFLNSVAVDVFGKALPIVNAEGAAQENVINVHQNPSLHAEGYLLEVTPTAINVTASTAHGVFYAFQSLRQMIAPEALTEKYVGSVGIQAAKIEDAPHFQHRGVLFDVCRHFFTVDEVMSVIVMLALL